MPMLYIGNIAPMKLTIRLKSPVCCIYPALLTNRPASVTFSPAVVEFRPLVVFLVQDVPGSEAQTQQGISPKVSSQRHLQRGRRCTAASGRGGLGSVSWPVRGARARSGGPQGPRGAVGLVATPKTLRYHRGKGGNLHASFINAPLVDAASGPPGGQAQRAPTDGPGTAMASGLAAA